MRVTTEGRPVFCGHELFRLKAEVGFPLDFALDRIINDERMAVDWVGFVEAARAGGWFDFQTLPTIEHALSDAGVKRAVAAGIVVRVKAHMMAVPFKAVLT